MLNLTMLLNSLTLLNKGMRPDLVTVSKTNKHRQIFLLLQCITNSVSQIHINPKRTRKKHQNDFFGRTYHRLALGQPMEYGHGSCPCPWLMEMVSDNE